jgi:hypothetical protein
VTVTPPYQLAAYYFPGYHPDPRVAQWHGEGWTEWELLRRAEPRFPAHQQPKVPAWGYQDESRPDVAEQKIAAAADHGLTAFIFDWYWYDNQPFLNGALDRGFLAARNNDRLRFALMWANHDWTNIQPLGRSTTPTLLARGAPSREHFETATDHVVSTYFLHPSYWRLAGRPYFSIYELDSLIRGLGGVAEARAALESFRRKARDAGAGEIHLNAVAWSIRILPGEGGAQDARTLLRALGFDSVTSYVWLHHTPTPSFPTVAYPAYAQAAMADWPRGSTAYDLPYFPNVTVGWDPSPRTVQSDRYDEAAYPFTSVLAGNTPAQFKATLAAARAFLDRGLTDPPVLTINAWNEWTEGSYLEPDTVHGLGYLEAIKGVFGAPRALAEDAGRG